ncbi:MAG: OprO/OprP family phosphate-selective porin [Planctomycetota bacterium]
MTRQLVTTSCAFVLAAVALSGAAWADDAPPGDSMRALVREEIEAYQKEHAGKPNDFRVYWKDGLRFETRDEKFKMKIGGRIQLDFTYFADSDARRRLEDATGGEWNSGAEFRRVRLFASGDVYEYFSWKLQLEFAGAGGGHDVVFKDVYVRIHDLDARFGRFFPNIYVGHFKEFFSLEAMNSSKYITFLERGLPVTTFAPFRSTGIGFFKDFFDERVTVGGGWWLETDDGGAGYFKDGQALTGRATWLPWAPHPSQFWEVGASGSWRFTQDGIRYRARPEEHMGDRILDVKLPDATREWRFGGETSFVYDRFSVQGEILGASPDVGTGNNPLYWGAYAQVSYFLSGGFRPFKKSYAVFDKVKPCRNFDAKGGGWGAWEVAARWSYLDLDDEGRDGGRATDVTVGLNWYLNPNARISTDYVHSDVKNAQGSGVDGTMDIVSVRFQVFF